MVIDSVAADLGGGLTYAKNLLPELAVQLGDHNPLLVCSKRNEAWLQEVWPFDVWVVPTALPARLAVQQLLPLLFPNSRILGTGNTAPLTVGAARSAVVVQDIRFFGTNPTTPASAIERAIRFVTRSSVNRAERVIAVSESLRSAIIHTSPRTEAKVRVALSASPERHSPRPPASQPVNSFALSLANGALHKRLEHTVEGWARAAIPNLDLVLVGIVPDPLRPRLEAASHGAAGELIMTGPVEDQETLAWYLGNAEMLISSSERESYGLTAAEAGLHGCRLLLTDLPAHREVCGSRATYFPPGRPDELARCIPEVLEAPRPQPWSTGRDWTETAETIAATLTEIAV